MPMATVRDVLDALEAIAPSRYAFSFDRIGLQVGDPSAQVDRLVVSLDPSLSAIRFAQSSGAQMLVSHHPVIWDPIKTVRIDDAKGEALFTLIAGKIAFAAAHTNWDAAPGGINDVLAELIGLQEVRAVGSVSEKEQYKVVVTVTSAESEALIDAMSHAGAGVIGLYERCAFSVDGTGTFVGSSGSNPAVGKAGAVEQVDETRIEMLCPSDALTEVGEAISRVHPYEEPAYDVFPVKPVKGQPISRMGRLPAPMSLPQFRDHLDRSLATRTLVCGPADRQIETVVVCGGAAADEWHVGNADAFVTGEVPHHLMVEASESGKVIAAAGHFATENPGALRLGDLLHSATGIEVLKFEPEPGESGRPR